MDGPDDVCVECDLVNNSPLSDGDCNCQRYSALDENGCSCITGFTEFYENIWSMLMVTSKFSGIV